MGHWLQDRQGKMSKIITVDGVPTKQILFFAYSQQEEAVLLTEQEVEHYTKALKGKL
jgi:hypothetical protein